jgi:rod shape-determining protein MreC
VSERADFFNKSADSTLALLVYCAVAVALVVVDRRLNYLAQTRQSLLDWVRPVWQLSEIPARLARSAEGYFVDRSSLLAANEQLRAEYLLQQQELFQLRSQQQSQVRLTRLISAIEAQPELANGVFARVMALDFSTNQHRLVVNQGAKAGLAQGSIAIDEGGLVGQVETLGSQIASLILVSDPQHRIPAQVRAGGERFYVSGTGSVRTLVIEQLALSAAIKVGDTVQTSGLGGVFPEGIPIGVVVKLDNIAGEGLLRAELSASAKLGTLREVFLIPPTPAVGPIAPKQPLQGQRK